MQTTTVSQTAEWTFISRASHRDPFHTVQLHVTFDHENGRSWRVPAFWAGGDLWRVRFASPAAGVVQGRTICSDALDAGLHDQKLSLRVLPYEGDNLLLRHGPITISPDQRHFQHVDGTPFFWLGDTQWMSLGGRIAWPGEFQTLQLDRRDKGFTVVQLVAGLMPDMAPLDPEGANEGGIAWNPKFAGINPKFFDYADRRIQYLIDIGIVPCIVGLWGFLRRFMTLEQINLHWHYLIARYASYPVVFCLAGEATTSYYLDPEADYWDEHIKGWRKNTVEQRALWTKAAHYLKSIEPFGRLITAHPPNFNDPQLSARTMLDDPDVLDFDMIQTHHGPTIEQGWHAVQANAEARKLEPAKPVVQAEGFYESILEGSREECQRFYFWSSMLTGCAGHTYGANGVWQLNHEDAPFRANPRKLHWGDRPWRDAMHLPGATQVGIGRRILERFDWWKFQPHPEWVEVAELTEHNEIAQRKHAALRPYAAGIDGKVRLIYMTTNWTLTPLKQVARLKPGGTYRASWINPSTGDTTSIGPIQPDTHGGWTPPTPPSMRDWLLCIE